MRACSLMARLLAVLLACVLLLDGSTMTTRVEARRSTRSARLDADAALQPVAHARSHAHSHAQGGSGSHSASRAVSSLRAAVDAASSASSSSSSSAVSSKRVGSPLGQYYHSTRELYDEIRSLATHCPHLTVEWQFAPRGVGKGKDADAPRKSLMAVRVNEGGGAKAERALLFFGEHARELISPETALEFLRRLCDPARRDETMEGVGATVGEVLSRTEFLLFPNANPSGRRITERGDYCNRVNDRAVDLNRNWGEHWSSASQHADTYPGTQAWSEAETVILARAAAQFKPTIFISVHSGSLHMLAPFAFKASTAGEPAASTTATDPPGMTRAVDAAAAASVDALSGNGAGIKPVLSVLRHVNQDFCRCAVGAAGKELGYLSPGTCLDWMYNRMGVRYAFALEIYSGKTFANRQLKRPARKAKHAAMLQLDAEADADADVEADAEADMDADADADADAGADGESEAEVDADAESGAEADADAEADAAEEAELAALAEVESEFFSRNGAQLRSLSELQSYPLPSFSLAELSTASGSAADPTDGDIPEDTRVLYPRAFRGRARKCLTGFNPVTRPMYQRTVDHWSRGLLALITNIHDTRTRN